jgi:hypothetical protein
MTAGMLLTMSALAPATTASAATPIWLNNLYAFEDCNPSTTSSGRGPGAERRCETAGGTIAHAKLNYTGMNLLSMVGAEDPAGAYAASGTIHDRFVVRGDPALGALPIRLVFHFALDGTMDAGSSFLLLADSVNWNGSGWSLRTVFRLDLAGPVSGSSTVDRVGSYSFEGLLNEPINTYVGASARTTLPGTTADFFSTWKMTGIDVTDRAGNPIRPFSLESGSGVDWSSLLPGTPPVAGAVPEPASWLLMIAGFGLVGAGARRRSSLRRAA